MTDQLALLHDAAALSAVGIELLANRTSLDTILEASGHTDNGELTVTSVVLDKTTLVVGFDYDSMGDIGSGNVYISLKNNRYVVDF